MRAYDPLRSTSARAAGGLSLLPGDATFSLATRGDLVLQDVADPGRAPQVNALAYANAGVNEDWTQLVQPVDRPYGGWTCFPPGATSRP